MGRLLPKPDNVQLRKRKKASPLTLLIYATINQYYKTPLYFYNNKKDMLKPLKPLPKPRKLIYITQEVYAKKVKEWEAKKPLPLKVVSKSYYKTQDYYTKQVLLKYITAIYKACIEDLSKSQKL